MGTPDIRKPLGTQKRRWEDNIKIDLQDLGWGMDWTDVAPDMDRWRAVVNAVKTFGFHKMWGIS